MGTQTLILTFATIVALTSVGCGSGATVDTGSSSAETITATPNPIVTLTGGTVVVTPSGGAAPYTFVLIGSSTLNALGTLTSTSAYTVFTAGSASGTAEVQITDSNNVSVQIPVTVAGSSGNTGSSTTNTGNIIVYVSSDTVSPGGTVIFSATGGSGSYTYSVVSPSNGGRFQTTTATSVANTYIPPAVTVEENITVQVTDSSGNFADVILVLNATSTATSSTACNGTFTLDLAGTAGTIDFSTDSGGSMSGGITINGSTASISGTCANNAVNFIDSTSGDSFTGVYYLNQGQSTGMWSGTFVDQGSTYGWTAQ